MKRAKMKAILGAAVLGLSVLGSSPSYAQIVVPTTVQAFKAMDMNKDGKLTKDEFLAALSKVFDKHAGAKGYRTPDEAAGVMATINTMFFNPMSYAP